jgi:hypothetical protein
LKERFNKSAKRMEGVKPRATALPQRGAWAKHKLQSPRRGRQTCLPTGKHRFICFHYRTKHPKRLSRNEVSLKNLLSRNPTLAKPRAGRRSGGLTVRFADWLDDFFKQQTNKIIYKIYYRLFFARSQVVLPRDVRKGSYVFSVEEKIQLYAGINDVQSLKS